MVLTFSPLHQDHFPLLLKWLMMPHVKVWWDQDVCWTEERIAEKYTSYVHGYKRLVLPTGTIEKPIHAYTISLDAKEIGYIQYYDKHDFPSEYGYGTEGLPASLAAIDWYIGEPAYLRKGIGTQALCLFLEKYVLHTYGNVFADPRAANLAAIRTYEKSGFVTIKRTENGNVLWMIKTGG